MENYSNSQNSDKENEKPNRRSKKFRKVIRDPKIYDSLRKDRSKQKFNQESLQKYKRVNMSVPVESKYSAIPFSRVEIYSQKSQGTIEEEEEQETTVKKKISRKRVKKPQSSKISSKYRMCKMKLTPNSKMSVLLEKDKGLKSAPQRFDVESIASNIDIENLGVQKKIKIIENSIMKYSKINNIELPEEKLDLTIPEIEENEGLFITARMIKNYFCTAGNLIRDTLMGYIPQAFGFVNSNKEFTGKINEIEDQEPEEYSNFTLSESLVLVSKKAEEEGPPLIPGESHKEKYFDSIIEGIDLDEATKRVPDSVRRARLDSKEYSMTPLVKDMKNFNLKRGYVPEGEINKFEV